MRLQAYYTMFLVQFVVSLRMSDEDMEINDEAAQNEEAYVIWGQGEKLNKLRHEAADYDHIEVSMTKSRAIGQVEMTWDYEEKNF